MCDRYLGGYDDGLKCDGTGHPYGHTFESTSGDVRGQQKSDGGGDDE